MTDTQRTTITAIASSAATTVLLLGLYAAANGQSAPSPANGGAPAVSTSLPPAVTSSSENIPETVSKTEPAVVSVVITKDVPVIERSFERRKLSPFEDPFFSPFDIIVPRERSLGMQPREVGGGTAFFVSSDGLLMTNRHVVDDPDATYTAFLHDGRKLAAKVVTTDPTNDVALLKVEGENFPFLQIADREPVLGETVIAIGNALAEFRNTVSVGVVSGLSRSIVAGSARAGSAEQLSRIIQTDAAINQGNSGGPLLSVNGQVLGMNTAVAGGAQNIAFAIPAKDLGRALRSYREHGRIVRPYLGVRYTYVTEELREKNRLDADHGVLVADGEEEDEPAVLPGSPADKAGIREGDIILEFNGERVDEEHPLAHLVQDKLPGEQVRLKILRQGQEQTVTATLEEWKTDREEER